MYGITSHHVVTTHSLLLLRLYLDRIKLLLFHFQLYNSNHHKINVVAVIWHIPYTYIHHNGITSNKL